MPNTTDLRAVLDDTIALFHQMTNAEGARRYGEVERSAGRPGILRSLAAGARTVPELARERPVSRQYVQTLVDALVAEGLLEAQPNPAHRRSPLLLLTAAGKKSLAAMARADARLLTTLAADCSPAALRTTARTLEALTAWFAEVQKGGSDSRSGAPPAAPQAGRRSKHG